MKTSYITQAALALMSAFVIAACSGKSRDGGGGGGGGAAPVPVAPATVSSDSFDNAHGAPALTSIRKTPIRNLTLSLIDTTGATPGYYIRVLFNFDGSGLLNATATIDTAAFDVQPVMGGIDPWTRSTNSQMANHNLVTFKALNIPYEFDVRAGTIRIFDFAAGSNVAAATIANMQTFGQSIGPARMGISFKSVSYNSDSRRHHFYRNFSNGVIDGQLVDFSTGDNVSPNDASQFRPQTSGFELNNSILISSGQITSSQGFGTIYQNGMPQPTQTTRDDFMPDMTKRSAFRYDLPTLDPRIQQ